MSHVTDLERQLVFEIADGNSAVIQYIGMYRNLCAKSAGMDYFLGLRWLKSQRLKGNDFISWLKEKHRGSILLAAAEIRKQAHHDFKTRKIYAKTAI